MSNEFHEYLKKKSEQGIGGWLMSAVITTAAVTLVGGAWAPFFTLPIGLVVSHFHRESMHEFNENHLLDRFRQEIGAVLGKDSRDVTLENLYTVANGSKALGLKGNNTLRDELEHLEKNTHRGDMVSILAGAITLGGLAIALSMGVASVAPDWAIRMGAGGANFLLNSVVPAWDYISDIMRPSSHSYIVALDREIQHGRQLTPERVLGAFVAADKNLDKKIQAAYGDNYEDLSPSLQRDVVNKIGVEYGVLQLTDGLNQGRILPTELAFILEGQRSGVTERNRDNFQKAIMTYEHVPDLPTPELPAPELHTPVIDQAAPISFVDKYLAEHSMHGLAASAR